jgi:hypothetical protein
MKNLPGRRRRNPVAIVATVCGSGPSPRLIRPPTRTTVVRVYLLEEVVEAHRHVETWQRAANVVLSLDA